MNDENKKKHFYLIVGYSGFLLLMLGIARYIYIINDTAGFALVMFGYIFLVYFFQFAENKIGVTSKEKVIFRIIFIAIPVLLGFIFLSYQIIN